MFLSKKKYQTSAFSRIFCNTFWFIWTKFICCFNIVISIITEFMTPSHTLLKKVKMKRGENCQTEKEKRNLLTKTTQAHLWWANCESFINIFRITQPKQFCETCTIPSRKSISSSMCNLKRIFWVHTVPNRCGFFECLIKFWRCFWKVCYFWWKYVCSKIQKFEKVAATWGQKIRKTE